MSLFGIEQGGQWRVRTSSGEDGAWFSAENARLTYGGRPQSHRSAILRVLFGVVTVLVLLRAATWQLGTNANLAEQADANRSATRRLLPPRAVIEDRYGTVLADNRPRWRVVLRGMPYLSLNQQERKLWLAQVERRLGTRGESLRQTLESYNPRGAAEVVVWDDIPYEVALDIMVNPLPPLDVELTTERQYPYQASATLAHVLGYVGAMSEEQYAETYQAAGYRAYDRVGKTGIEAQYEQILRGTVGRERYEVNAAGQLMRLLDRTPPVPSESLQLSIDIAFQTAVEESMRRILTAGPVARGAFVALDPRSGEVLALVSFPGYPVDAFAGGISQAEYEALRDNLDAPLFARATAGEYPAGSTIKPLYVAAGLTEGVIDENTTVQSTGGVWLGNRFFPDWRAGGHGSTDYRHAIADSVNTYFYILGGGNETRTGMGLELLMDWNRRFGLGQPTGIDVPFETDGFLPSKAWKEEVKGEQWFIGDTYNVSIGQGDLLVSPLQMAYATQVFAAQGMQRTPHIVRSTTPQERRVVSAEIAGKVAAGMRDTVTRGTATSLQSVGVPVAGKTGTAQWNAKKAPHSWFTGFAPYDDPQITIAVLAEEGGEMGLAVAIAREALTWYTNNRILPERTQEEAP